MRHLQNGSMMFHGFEKLSAQPVSWHSDPSLSCLQAQEKIIIKSGVENTIWNGTEEETSHKYHINNQESLYIPLISLNYLTYII